MSYWLRFLAAILISVPLMAVADEPDEVVLTSGNRMTGTISALSRGQLSFSIAGAGSVDIDWHNVESLKSAKTLDVDLASGERLTGPITSPSKGKLEVKTAQGARTVEMKDVVRIQAVGATFVERTTGSIEAGLGVYQAHSEFDLTLDAEAENQTRNYLTEASFMSLLRRLDGVNNLERNDFLLGVRRFLPNRWFVLGQFELEQDAALDLDLRVLVAGSLGRYLVKSNRTHFSAYGGFDYNGEHYGGVPNSRSGEGLGALEWDWFDVQSKTELNALARSFFTLNSSRIRLELKTEIKHDIYKKYFGAINFFEAFDSKPPAGQADNDYGLSITIGRSF